MNDRIETDSSLNHIKLIHTDDGSVTLKNKKLDESYRSEAGAVAESFHVYLSNSGIREQIESNAPSDFKVPSDASSNMIRVLEVGFGTGLNFLLTAAYANACTVPLEYVGLEHQLLPTSVFEQLRLPSFVQSSSAMTHTETPSRFPQMLETTWSNFVEARRSWDESRSNPRHTVMLDRVRLILECNDARSFLGGHDLGVFDAVYFDPFSPRSSPELWVSDVFAQLYRLLKPGGCLTTYCVAGQIRRNLQAVGFEVQRLAGPTGGKRQVLRARRIDL
jgi:tRNA U34 5-methylaminomethyl-2-thiouridine-forming methyltransferase MnmC